MSFASEHDVFQSSLGVEITPLWLDGRIYGYRIKETGTHFIEVMRMIYNWRVVTVPKRNENLIDRAWCYQGTGLDGFLPAALAAIAWDGSDDTEPPGYFKRAGT